MSRNRASAVAAADAPTRHAAPAASAGPRMNRFTMLAAALALSAALGGMVGALGASALLQPAPAPAVAGRTGLEEIQALKENVVQARVELAALKVSIDAGNRNASAQFTRIGERVERIERIAGRARRQAQQGDRDARSPGARRCRRTPRTYRLDHAAAAGRRRGSRRAPAPSRDGWCAMSSAAPR